MFRNVRLYRMRGDWPTTEAALQEALEKESFTPCGPFVARSAGFEAVSEELPGALVRRVGGADLLRLRRQSRVLPSAAVNEALEDRVADFSKRTRRKPGPKEKRDLKDEVIAELMPKSLVKSERIWIFYLVRERVLGVDTASEPLAEAILDRLRDALGSLEVTPLAFDTPVSRLLTSVFLGSGPPAFAAGRECRMLDPAVGSSSITMLDVDLGEPGVQRHVRDGMKIERLAVDFDGEISLVLGDDLVIRKLNLGALAAGGEEDLDDEPLARLDADFVLATGVLVRLLRAVEKQLGGYA